MKDQLARQSNEYAHKRITELAEEVHRLRNIRTKLFATRGKCHLCGDPCSPRHHYCHAHSWAAGSE